MSKFKIDLSDRKNYKYTFRGFVEVEEKLGDSYINLDSDSFTVKQIAVIIWGALLHLDDNLDVMDVYTMIDEQEVPFQGIMMKALEEFTDYNERNLVDKN